MATITDTYLEVHLGTTASGTLVGQQIHKSGSPQQIALDDTELGVDLNPGTRYCAIAKCINSDNYDSGWYGPVPFQTKIYAEILSMTVQCGGTANAIGRLTYDTNDNVVEVVKCGVWYSTSPTGVGYVEVDDGDGTDFTTQGIQVGNNLTENTTYYYVPFATDQLGQTYHGAWSAQQSFTTLYNAPTITNLSTTHTYNSVGGSVTLNSSDNLKASGCYVMIYSGGSSYKKMLTTTKGEAQSFSFVDGGTDDNGNTITITSGTSYTVRVFAQNNQANGCSNTETTSVTTDQQTPTSISFTVSDITPYSAVANLVYE